MGKINKRKVISKKIALKTVNEDITHNEEIPVNVVEVEKKPLGLSNQSRGMSRKQKMKVKKENLKQKLLTSLKKDSEAKAAKKRKRRPIIGDLDPMTEALNLAIQEATVKTPEPVKKPKGTLKRKKRQHNLMENIDAFRTLTSSISLDLTVK